ncbi:glycosyltransferase family 2 protein [Candidatus Pelagibacter sp.]|nr:glycosyltransferase family 2 protein [Candidatus Pelagibacter sp.]
MISNKLIAAVVPVFNVGENIKAFLKQIPEYVDQIYLIDDCCPLKTGKIVEENISNFKKVSISYNNKNLGVGGAVKVGYQESLKNNIDIIVKIDGDNQMNPNEINKLVEPLLSGVYDYTKGNRFLMKGEIENYPKVKFYGNIFLSFMSKLSSGYWDIYDPINGYTAITKECLQKLSLDKIDNGYFFESDMLFNLYLDKFRVKDIPVEIKYYKNQIQNMSIIKESFNFFFKNISRTFKRVKIVYFKNNFTLGSFFAGMFFINAVLTIFYGGSNYLYHYLLNEFAPTGVIVISSIFLLLTSLSFMIFLILDNYNNPNR